MSCISVCDPSASVLIRKPGAGDRWARAAARTWAPGHARQMDAYGLLPDVCYKVDVASGVRCRTDGADRVARELRAATSKPPVFKYKCKLVDRTAVRFHSPYMLPDPFGPAAPPRKTYIDTIRCNHESCAPGKRKARAAVPLQREWSDVGTGDLGDYITREPRQWEGGNGRSDAVLRLCDGSYGCVVCDVSATRAKNAKRKCRDWKDHMPTTREWGGENMLHRDVATFDAAAGTCAACVGGDDQ